jgi:hypothetical protein
MLDPNGMLLAIGYSGAGDGKNNVLLQDRQNVGPIPEGMYHIEEPRDTQEHGPYAMPLEPYLDNLMFHRSNFLIHGDSVHAPGAASEGCVIMPKFARERIWESEDHTLHVIAYQIGPAPKPTDPEMGQ